MNENLSAVAEALGYRSVFEVTARGRDAAGRRLAAWLGLPAETPEAVLVLGRLVELFVERAHVPPFDDWTDVVEESWSTAGYACPRDPDLRARAAAGLGLGDDLRLPNVCHVAMLALFFETMRARGEIDSWDRGLIAQELERVAGDR